jgi:hypothetical protein
MSKWRYLTTDQGAQIWMQSVLDLAAKALGFALVPTRDLPEKFEFLFRQVKGSPGVSYLLKECPVVLLPWWLDMCAQDKDLVGGDFKVGCFHLFFSRYFFLPFPFISSSNFPRRRVS